MDYFIGFFPLIIILTLVFFIATSCSDEKEKNSNYKIAQKELSTPPTIEEEKEEITSENKYEENELFKFYRDRMRERIKDKP